MPNLIDIRRRIKSTKNTAQITKAMKMVSASRLRRASERATEARPYAERLFDVHRSILARMQELDGELYQTKKGKTLLVVVAGDKGLCGSFNANIFKHAENIFRHDGLEHFVVLPVGRKSVAYFAEHEAEVLDGYENIFRNVTMNTAEDIGETLVKAFSGEGIGRVQILFNKFRNVLVQDVTEWQLLPLAEEPEEEEETSNAGPEHLAEPGLEEILNDLSPRVITTRLYQALLESCASEHAARMTAMDAATNNAKDMIERLTLEMNKARQAAITTELIEVVSGAAAL
ncbi:MAG: ATP synthase F1 subunit gamma [Acidobacteriota bacterium]|nr:ATP synthase F1 subunit gamma [Acidobacteriota bacterium]